MNKSYLLLICLLQLMVLGANAQVIDSRYVDGEVFVKTRDTSSMELAPYNHGNAALNLLYTQYGIDTITRPFGGLNTALDHTYRVKFHMHAQVDNLVAALQNLPFVEYCEKAPLFKTTGTPYYPNDYNPGNQYQLTKIFAPDAWGVSHGTRNVVLAIVDNAVRISHADLLPNLWTNPSPGGVLSQYPNDLHGFDVADNDNNPNPPAYTTDGDGFCHGTHCAGIAGAATDNNKGVSSIAFNVSIMPVKCTPDNAADSGESLPNAYDGLYYAINANANVISMSWGGSDGSFLTGEALINSAYNKGIVLVAAAGNENVNTPFYPAAFNHVLSVGATSTTDTKATYSNYGSDIDVMAPGNYIYSTMAGSDTTYGYFSGTSMACPLVAGLAALVRSANPSWTADQVMNQIENTCDDIDLLNPTYAGQLGHGRINAARALGATPTVGIASINSDASHALWLAPNPNNGYFGLYWAGQQPLDEVWVFDYTGRQIMHQTPNLLSGSSTKIDLSTNLPTGFYILKGISAGQAYVYRFVVE